VGVLKVWIAEFCDETNASQGLATLPTAWGIGVVLGPSIGGLLAQPAEQYPNSVFAQSQLLRDYPFLLPCLAASLITYLICFVCFIFAEETLPYQPESLLQLVPCSRGPRIQYTKVTSGPSGVEAAEADESGAGRKAPEKAASRGGSCGILRDRNVRGAVLMYCMCALIYIVLDETLPFLLREDRRLGGGGMTQATIGILIATGGAALLTGPWVVPPLERRWGRRTCLQLAFSLLIPIHLGFPFCTWLVSTRPPGKATETCAAVLIVSLLALKNILGSIAFTMAFLFINSSVNNDSARLGLVNGISQMGAAMARSAGPLMV